MRFEVADFNDGWAVLAKKHPAEWAELQAVLSETQYHVQLCNQKGRTEERIFSPSMANSALKDALLTRGWEAGVRIENSSYESGKDVDFFKNGVVLEVQFAHYGLLQADISRMEQLHTDVLRLAGGRKVSCGVEIVVTNGMPRSQSVAHMEQAQTRAAPIARTIPVALVGIQPPVRGEQVVLHEIQPRSRRSDGHRLVRW